MDEKTCKKLRKGVAERNGNDKGAMALYDAVCAAASRMPGGLTEASAHIAGMIADSEHMANLYREDIRQKGVRETWYNGRQHGERENKSCAALRATMEQQRKLLNEMKITPGSLGEGAAGMSELDAFD